VKDELYHELKLSTPSLGITESLAAIVAVEWVDETFNSLSRDHTCREAGQES